MKTHPEKKEVKRMEPVIREYVEKIRGGCWNCEAVTRAREFEAQMDAWHRLLDAKEEEEVME